MVGRRFIAVFDPPRGISRVGSRAKHLFFYDCYTWSKKKHVIIHDRVFLFHFSRLKMVTRICASNLLHVVTFLFEREGCKGKRVCKFWHSTCTSTAALRYLSWTPRSLHEPVVVKVIQQSTSEFAFSGFDFSLCSSGNKVYLAWERSICAINWNNRILKVRRSKKAFHHSSLCC